MNTASKARVDIALRDDWLGAIDALQNTIRAWVTQEPNWTTGTGKTESIYEDTLGEYTAPLLTIHSPEGELRVEPIARNFARNSLTHGIVEMYAWPTLRRVRLLASNTSGSEWRVLTDSGIYLHQDWNRDNFMTLARDLIQAN